MNLKPISECILELFYVKTESGPTLTENVKLFHFESTLLEATMTLQLPSIWNNPKSLFFVTLGLRDSEGGEKSRDGAVYLLSETETVYSISTSPREKAKDWISSGFQTARGNLSTVPPLPPPLQKDEEEEDEEEKITSHHIKEKHLSLQGPSSDVTLNRFMLTKC